MVKRQTKRIARERSIVVCYRKYKKKCRTPPILRFSVTLRYAKCKRLPSTKFNLGWNYNMTARWTTTGRYAKRVRVRHDEVKIIRTRTYLARGYFNIKKKQYTN